ncbi:hypothetical protein HaLaN_01505 [Haematococcus lacustris]|uniref:Uncharacterized protein n=1 Tax=Haematococcus lacustris TaxID=44745 RepID=A0A699Y9D8_HAELA|nr:hypothetical protein HaLaN_01505 [Haematococcus lacustris]
MEAAQGGASWGGSCQLQQLFLSVYNQLQRRLVRPRQRHHPMLMPDFEDPSNQALLAKLQELGSIDLRGDANTIGAHSMQLAVAIQQHYFNPGKARLGWSGEAQLFIKMACGYGINAQSSELQAANLDKGHVADLVDSRVLHGVCKQLGLTKETKAAFTSEPALSHHWARWFNTGQLVADKLARWKLIKGQVKHASGLNNACRDTERWLAHIKPHLQHLAAASSAGTSLVANLKHTTVTLATWDAVWEVYLDPKLEAPSRAGGTAPVAPSLEPAT